MKIDLLIRFKTRFGQSLSVTGNIPALGSNNSEDALQMNYLNENFWQASFEVNPEEEDLVQYRYIFITEGGEKVFDGEMQRVLSLKNITDDISVIDTWIYSGSYELTYLTSPFQNIYFKHHQGVNIYYPDVFTHFFKVKAPLLGENECICLLGNTDQLKNWQTEQPILLGKEGDWWQVKLDLVNNLTPVSYKYGVYDLHNKSFVRWEEGENREVNPHHPIARPIILHDGFIRLPNTKWKGTGVAIPVFSLRTNNSAGVGEFSDIKLLADWAVNAGLKLIQILPVNDTSATFTFKDSYPYAAISAFALHPVYINLQHVAGKKNASLLKPYEKQIKQLNDLPEVDYEAVIQLKLKVLRELFEKQPGDFMKEEGFQAFYNDNIHWLKPYAAFCFFRDKFGTSEFQKWNSNNSFQQLEIDAICTPGSDQFQQISFWFFVQYHLHLQLQEAVAYAHDIGLAIKGDIPIGIYRFGCDAWTAPDQYNMNWQAGAPPDDFAVKGQNWGFPTYNWNKMQENGFEWWRQRFHQMSYYFDAFRIDHILGFFRIWSIPIHAVEGIMGRFVPALPVHINEFGENGISFNYDRFCKPFINWDVLRQLFGENSSFIAEEFLLQKDQHSFVIKDEFNTQQKVEHFFSKKEKTDANQAMKEGLFDLISNVLLFEHEGSNGQEFHFRISMIDTLSYQHLDGHSKHHLYELYINYFYNRQDEFWKHEALRKLPALKEATNMLICGEDLGMVPHSVPEVMKDLGILSLEIQRMPKNPKTEFFHPKDAPYLSVVTPSTHDMSTIRGWWEESAERTQRFYNIILGEHGQAPAKSDSRINRNIILQHLYAPSMWSIFQLQDLLSIDERLSRVNPHDERINNPADPNHYWNYRLHLTLEQLLTEQDFNHTLKDYIHQSGRG